MKKKRRADAFALLLAAGLALVLGLSCGSDEDLDPISELHFKKADPGTFQADADPTYSRIIYFVFQIQLSDPALSVLPMDAWTIDRYDVAYSLVSDPGGHLLGLPEDLSERAGASVTPGIQTRFPITMIQDTYLADNAAGFIGTGDVATVQARVTFKTHRNRDGAGKILSTSYTFTIGDF